MSPLQRALGDLQVQFENAWQEATALGLSTDNLASAHQAAIREVEKQFEVQKEVVQVQRESADDLFRAAQQRRLEIHALREQIGLYTPLQRALSDLQVEFENAWRAANQLGESTRNLSREHTRAIVELVNQQRLQVHGVREMAGVWTPLQRALADLQVEFGNLWHQADRLGISTRNLGKIHQAAIDQLMRDERLRIHAAGEAVGVFTPFQRQLMDLQVQFEQAAVEASRLGLSIGKVVETHQEAIRALQRQQQAQIDAMALSITNPFEQLLEPLRALGIELDRSLMNPLEQFNASAQNFRDTLARARAGEVDAIEQLDEAGQNFIATATSVGASPAQAEATREVQAGLQEVMGQVQNAQAQASRGIEGAIWGANQRVVDTLRELVVVGQQQIAEMRRLQRGLT